MKNGFHISAAQISSIYDAYPRHIGKVAAVKAIEKALKTVAKQEVSDPVAFLLDRTKQFAKSPAGNAGKFTPHPSTWFNQGRYDDDPAEWERGEVEGKPREQKALDAWDKAERRGK